MTAVKAQKLQRGRPEKKFKESGIKAKKRKIQDLMNRPSEELSFAVESKFREEGKRYIAEVIKKTVTTSPKSLKQLNTHPTEKMVPYTPDEALALIADLKLTKHQYKHLQKSAKDRNANIYPTYDSILEAKKRCYPPRSSITATETLCEIELQQLLDYTTQRISVAQGDIFDFRCENDDALECTWKWGADGSGGHSRYKQNFLVNASASDSDILLTCIMPLEIKKKSETESTTIWINSRTSSPRYCRPVRFEFTKESTDITIAEFRRMELEINALQPTYLNFNDKNVRVTHTLFKTMVDGKTCNAVMKNRSSTVCYICKASPKEMNNIDECSKKSCDTNAFAYGLQTLHAQIRLMEALLHIAYKLDTKSWQARGDAAKNMVKDKKTYLQNQLRSELGILVDFPKQGGGNTNDGNTARTFFKDPAKTARIIGIEQKLVERFAIIIKTISSGLRIDTTKFRKYNLDTAKLFVNKYKWYRMPVSVHKILLHGADIIETFPIPIGQLSEDVLEARQKDYKTYRAAFSRKMSRISTNTDVLHNLLISSDPIISDIRDLPKRHSKPLPAEVLEMVLESI